MQTPKLRLMHKNKKKLSWSFADAVQLKAFSRSHLWSQTSLGRKNVRAHGRDWTGVLHLATELGFLHLMRTRAHTRVRTVGLGGSRLHFVQRLIGNIGIHVLTRPCLKHSHLCACMESRWTVKKRQNAKHPRAQTHIGSEGCSPSDSDWISYDAKWECGKIRFRSFRAAHLSHKTWPNICRALVRHKHNNRVLN